MRKYLLAGAALAVLGASALAAQPGQGQRGAQPLTRAAVEARVDAAFIRVDANGDGFVTREEARAAAEARRGKRGEARAEHKQHRGEARGERKQQRGEARGQRRGGHGGGMFSVFGGRMFEQADADGDGRVSRAEARAAALATFDRIDANRDGTISWEERRAAREAWKSQRRQPAG